jgi:hypothetical protein
MVPPPVAALPPLAAWAVATLTATAAGTPAAPQPPADPSSTAAPSTPPGALAARGPDEPGRRPAERRAVSGPLQLMAQVGLSWDRYRQATPNLGGEVSYRLRDALTVAAFGSGYFPLPPVPPEYVSKLKAADALAAAGRTELRWATGLALRWRPIRGVVAWDRAVLATLHLDVGVGVGLGATRAPCANQRLLDPNRGYPEDSAGNVVCNPDEVDTPAEVPPQTTPRYYAPDTLRPLGVLEVGLELELARHLALRLAVRDLIFASRVYLPGAKEALEDEVVHRASLALGLGLAL